MRPVSAVLSVFVLVLAPVAAQAAKTDIVGLVNGDKVTGEIKSLDFGSLSYKTDSMGTVTIDWEDVVSLTSEQNLQVELVNGTKYFGRLLAAGEEGGIRIRTASTEVTYPVRQVVRMTPIDPEEGFLEKLDGSFSLGFQGQKSSQVNTSALAADITYRERKYLVGLRLNSTVTNQSNEPSSSDQSIDLNYQSFRRSLWFSDWFSGWERNDELGIQARLSAGGAFGRYFVQTNSNEFSVTGGAQASREAYVGEDPNETVYEGRVEIRYLHRRNDPKTTFNFTSQVYPSLSETGEYRAESGLNLNWEFIEDMFLGVGVNYSYTSDPPTGAAKADYSVTTSLGYSF